MSMPLNLVLVRHSQSEANIMQSAAKQGDNSLYTEDVMMVADRLWRISPQGIEQAKTSGEWIKKYLPNFDRYIVSPYIRTRETAAYLNLDEAQWEENRVVRERSWGEIDGISRDDFHSKYPLNAIYKKKDPLYWSPPGGESIANVAENRVRNVLNTLHRENSKDNVVIVTHGEFIWAVRTVLERWSDEQFIKYDKDSEYKIHNAMVLHYSRIDPISGNVANKIRWVRTAYPIFENECWNMKVSEWKEFDRTLLSNEGLLDIVNQQEYFLDFR